MNGVRSRHSSLPRNIEDISSRDDKIDESVVPRMICIIDRSNIGIREEASVVDVQDTGIRIVEKQGFLGKLPSERSVVRDVVECCVECVVVPVVAKVGSIPLHHRPQLLDRLILAGLAVVAGNGLWIAGSVWRVLNDTCFFVVLSDSAAA